MVHFNEEIKQVIKYLWKTKGLNEHAEDIRKNNFLHYLYKG